MTDLTKIPLPRAGRGPVTWESLVPYLETYAREVLARTDARNPKSDFADGLVANPDGSVTLDDAYPAGRTATVAGLTQRLTDAGRASDQRFLPIVSAGNRLSAQTTNPLSSTGSATTASISIASHVVQYGFGTISYNGGTISGLTPLTTYFVYASDPGYAGGDVTYAATTSPATVVSDNGFYYVGSIETANSTPTGNVAAASSTSPITIRTSADHGFSNGNQVTFAAMPGDFAALNGHTYLVAVVDPDEFTVTVDASTWVAYTSGGTVTRVSSTSSGSGGGGGWNWIGEIP